MKYFLILFLLAAMCATKPKIQNPSCSEVDGILSPNDTISKIDAEIDRLEDNIKKEGGKADEDLLVRTDRQLYAFKDKNSDKIIGLELCCDGAQTVFIFHQNEIPGTIINHYKDKEYFSQLGYYKIEDTKKYIEKKIKYATELDSKYFVTIKGAKLGMTSSDAIKIYGQPDSTEVIKKDPKVVRYKWVVVGEDDKGSYKEKKEEDVCHNLGLGYDCFIDFAEKKKGRDEAVSIFIDQHIM